MCAILFFCGCSQCQGNVFVSITDVGNSYWELLNHIFMYHALKVTGWWETNNVVGLLEPIVISDLAVGKPFCIPFDCMYYGYWKITRGAVVVIYTTVTAMNVDVLLWSVDNESVHCLVICHIVFFTHKCKWQGDSDPILDNQDANKIWQDPFIITVGSATTGVYVHWISWQTDVAKYGWVYEEVHSGLIVK